MRRIVKSLVVLLTVITTACSNDENPKNEAPLLGVLKLASPVDASTCEGVSTSATKCEVNLTWLPTTNHETYVLTVTNLSTNKVVIVKNDITETNFKIILDKKMPYSWTVSARENQSKQIFNVSPVWKFYPSAGESVANLAPFPADLLAPIQDKTVSPVNGTILLKWAGSDPNGDSLKYTVYLDKVDGMQTPVAELSNLTTTQATANVTPGVYYWRVKSSDSNSSSFSQIVRFVVN